MRKWGKKKMDDQKYRKKDKRMISTALFFCET